MVVVVFLAVATVATVGYVRHRSRTDPFFYAEVYGSCELPQDKIREAFGRISERDLPEVVRNARGIWWGGREPRIFLRFDTDANGIASIEKMFDTPQAEREILDGSRLRGLVVGGWTGFSSADVWQEKTGVRIFDPKEWGAGKWITHNSSGGEYWQVYIDEEHGAVYLYYGPYT